MKHLNRLSSKKHSKDLQHHGESSKTSTGRREVGVNVLNVTIQLIQQVTDLIPINLVKHVLKGINSILLLIQKYIQNKLDLKGLAEICKDICSTLARAMNGVSMEQLSDVVKDGLEELNSSIGQLHSKVSDVLQHGRVRRLFGVTLDQKTISDWTGELDRIQRSFSTKVNIVSAVRLDQIYYVLKHPEIRTLIPEPPPAPPAFFFGRERLFAEVKGALLSDEAVALIGPGGIGKSTLAKVLINDNDIQNRYGRRFFVSYDGIDPTTITTGAFVDRVAVVLGLPTRGVEGKNQVISNLASSPVLIVLDNAETFEDAAKIDTADEIASIVANMANTRGVTVMLTSRTSRSPRDACWTDFDVQPLEKAPARQCFRKIYHGDIGDDDIDELLAAVDYHPLSIHILAFAARESRWTGEELLERWRAQQGRLLQRGHRKENLGFTIRLSLNSPSVQNLGDDAMSILGIVAFLPQGINLNHAPRLFPSIHNIMLLLDTLCDMSLVYRSGPFITILAPIRLFLLDEFPTAGLGLLDDVRRTYFESLDALSEKKDSYTSLIISDHRNLECFLMYDVASSPGNIRRTTRACRQFLDGLRHHNLRPTPLGPVIFSFPEGSASEKDSKAQCLFALGSLYFELSNYGSAVTAHLAASSLFVAAGNHSMASSCTSNAATYNINQAYYSRARKLLEDFIDSPSWQCIEEEDRTGIYYTLDFARMHMCCENADELFLHSMDHWHRGLSSRVRHWQARVCYGYNTPEEAQRNLQPLQTSYMASSNIWDRWKFLEIMAGVAFLQRKYDLTMQLLNQAYDTINSNFLLALIVLYNQAAVASVQGNYELAQSLLQQTLDALGAVTTAPSMSTKFLDIRYVQGRNELYAKRYLDARKVFSDIIVECDTQGNIKLKMFCTRALGEAESLLGCKVDSNRYFAQTEELCREAGMPPELLGVLSPLIKLDDNEFPAWSMFLQARTPPAPLGSINIIL